MAQRVYLQTEDPGVGHIVKDVDVKDDGNSGRLFDGDVATILSTRPDYVLDDLTMQGDVEQPGTYQYVGEKPLPNWSARLAVSDRMPTT